MYLELREWTVPTVDDAGDPMETFVVVKRTDAEVIVVWVCGAIRTFMPADLRRALERFDLVMANNGQGDLWYGDRDSTGSPYDARLDDGNFMADESTSDRAYRVPWDEFSKALKAAIPKPRIRKAKK